MSTQVRHLKTLHIQILIATCLAAAMGLLTPSLAVSMSPLGHGFVALLRMMVSPVIFVTVVLGLSRAGKLRSVSRIGLKALLYFEAMSTVGLLLGFAAVSLLRPGEGLHATGGAVADSGGQAIGGAPQPTLTAFLLEIIPRTPVNAFARGDILPVLLVSVLTGAAVNLAGRQVSGLVELLRQAELVVFRMLGLVMRLAPIGVFGALASAIGASSGHMLAALGEVLALFYCAASAFVLVVLGGVTWASGLPLVRVLRLVREELLLVFAAASVEVVLPRLIARLEQAGVDSAVAGLVLPAGYSLNRTARRSTWRSVSASSPRPRTRT